jgi:hypothetical protein
MALELVQPGIQPLGQFDGYDNVYLTVLGGEVATLVQALVGGTDLAAYDAGGADGYVSPAGAGKARPAATTNLVSGSRPLFLVDDGIAGYGTMFGSLVGGVCGQIATGGVVLGPHTAAGSGKLTLWDKPGTYAVTLDAVDTTAATGLVPTNTTLQIGDALYATSAGLLTPRAAGSFEASVVVGRFINFETYKGGSLVNTPIQLVSALNSPVSYNSNAQVMKMARALIYWAPPIH